MTHDCGWVQQSSDLTGEFLSTFGSVTYPPVSSCRMHQDQILQIAQGNLVSEDAEVTKEVSETVSEPLHACTCGVHCVGKSPISSSSQHVVGAYITSSVFKVDLYRLRTD